MARVFLTSAADTSRHPYARRDLERLLAFARVDRHGVHALAGDPRDADLVVFVGSDRPNLLDVRRSPVFREFRHKAAVFDAGDRCIPLLPGLYAGLQARWARFSAGWARAGWYLRVAENDALDPVRGVEQAEFLFSFLGNAAHHPVRRRILALAGPRAFLRDTSRDGASQDDGAPDAAARYRDVLARSAFVLCPRGLGVSTWRLFEVMRAGRVPVVVSDDWLPPEGPDWPQCSLRVREGDVASIPRRLAAQEHRAAALAARARAEWERWFARDVAFHTAVEGLLAAHAAFRRRPRLRALGVYAQYAEPFFLRHWALSPLARRLRGRAPP